MLKLYELLRSVECSMKIEFWFVKRKKVGWRWYIKAWPLQALPDVSSYSCG